MGDTTDEAMSDHTAPDRREGTVRRIAEWVTYLVAGLELISWIVSSKLLFLQPDVFAKVVIVTQGIVILVLFGFLVHLPPTNRPEKYQIAIANSLWFVIFWNCLWGAWLLFYICLAYSQFDLIFAKSFYGYFALEFLSSLAGAFLILCYLCMILRSLTGAIKLYQALFFVLLMSLGMLAIQFVIIKWIPDWEEARIFFDALYGLLGGVGLALLVGRLDSKYINSPLWMIIILYVYAVIQFAYPLVIKVNGTPTEIRASGLIIGYAFLAKMILFWRVRELVSSRNLTYYLVAYLATGSPPDREEVLRELTPVPAAS